eukprot:46481-Eustigmatos_ZCMA.PRE.1
MAASPVLTHLLDLERPRYVHQGLQPLPPLKRTRGERVLLPRGRLVRHTGQRGVGGDIQFV